MEQPLKRRQATRAGQHWLEDAVHLLRRQPDAAPLICRPHNRTRVPARNIQDAFDEAVRCSMNMRHSCKQSVRDSQCMHLTQPTAQPKLLCASGHGGKCFQTATACCAKVLPDQQKRGRAVDASTRLMQPPYTADVLGEPAEDQLLLI